MTNNRKKRLLWQVPFLALLIVGTIFIIRQQQSTPYQKNAGLIFGTTYSVIYQYDDANTEWVAKSGSAGEDMIPITNAEIDNLFI